MVRGTILRRITATDIVLIILIQMTKAEDPREHHIRSKPKPRDSPVPDRFFLDNMNTNPHPYQFVMNNEDLCEGEVHLVMLVRSAPGHADRRQAIRETWGDTSDTKPRIVLAFLVGETNVNAQQQQLENEYSAHDDIIQADYKDSYRNLTIKDVSAFKWIIQHCKHAEFAMIGSDEILIDITKLLSFLNRKQRNEDRKFILCHLYPCCTKVYRQHPKYNVSELDYESPAFPAYCSGTAYIAKPSLLEQLYHMSIDTPSFMPDDAWIGVMAEKLGAQFHDSYRSFTGIRNRPTVLKDLHKIDYIERRTMIAVLDYDFPGREAEMMRTLWQKMLTHHRTAERNALEYRAKRRSTLINILTMLGAIIFISLMLRFRNSKYLKRRISRMIRWRP